MASIRADGYEVPLFVPLSNDGFARVEALELSLKFLIEIQSLRIEIEVFDCSSGRVIHTVAQSCLQDDVGKSWLLPPGKYRAYGFSLIVMNVTTPRQSLASTMHTPITSVKVEPGFETIHFLSDDSDDGMCLPWKVAQHTQCASTFIPSESSIPQESFVATPFSTSKPPLPHKQPPVSSIVDCLKMLVKRKGSKNVFKRINFDSIII